jgi:hypothetical protein
MSEGLLILTWVHVIISLVGIGSGFVVIYGFLAARRLDIWTAIFLATTVLTSVTGFFFPVDHFTPGHAIGILSLMVLGPALWGRYSARMAGTWRTTYVICAMIAQYFNFAVLIIQSFGKVPVLKALAPTQSEPPFLVTHLIVLASFVALTWLSVIRFRNSSNPKSVPLESASRTDVAVVS